MTLRVLILGGSAEASALGRLLVGDQRFEPVMSLAGRTDKPAPQPVHCRVGGFGGVEGLAGYLVRERVHALIDATHPFAAQMSRHAVIACAQTGTPLLALERPPWEKTAADLWTCVPDVAAAVEALGNAPKTVFCGLGRLALPELVRAPQHQYVIRLIDEPPASAALPQAIYIQARGPFATDDDVALFREHAIEAVLSKNAGGAATFSKIEAARRLYIPVIMVERPPLPTRMTVATVEAAYAWLEARYAEAAERGV